MCVGWARLPIAPACIHYMVIVVLFVSSVDAALSSADNLINKHYVYDLLKLFKVHVYTGISYRMKLTLLMQYMVLIIIILHYY